MHPSHSRYSYWSIEIRRSDHYIQYMRKMILDDHDMAMQSLAWLYTKKPIGQQKLGGAIYARAVYLRYFKDLKLHEIAQELNLSKERTRQLVEHGLYLIQKYLKREYNCNAYGA